MLISAGAPALALDGEPPQMGSKMLALPAEETNMGEPKPEGARDESAQQAVCLIIESAAKANDLPLEFFVRVIWQESRFQSEAVGPVTRNGQRAEGIAQFMPGTASERRLLDPFDPVQALPKSAEFLNELRNQFGNLGLAAAAYNAGPRRVQEWLAGSVGMPQETRNYVAAITGISVDDWALANKKLKMADRASNPSCRELLAWLKRSPNPFVTQLEHRVTRAAAKPWGVQISAGFNRDNALAMYARAMKGLSAVGRWDDPLLVHTRGTGTFYHVQIGTDTHRAADDLCSQLRRAGGACLVKRNKVERPQISRTKTHVARSSHAALFLLVRTKRGPISGRPKLHQAED